MKKALFMLTWFLFQTEDPGKVASFLNALPAKTETKISVVQTKSFLPSRFYVFYNADEEVKLK